MHGLPAAGPDDVTQALLSWILLGAILMVELELVEEVVEELVVVMVELVVVDFVEIIVAAVVLACSSGNSEIGLVVSSTIHLERFPRLQIPHLSELYSY